MNKLPSNLFTLYGRQAVLEALHDTSLHPYKLHMADSNRREGAITDMLNLAQQAGIDVVWHTRLALSRISKNGKQDQGVALDLLMPNLQNEDALLAALRRGKPQRYLVLDGITNPQNVGMIIRSAAAGQINGVILPKRGCARLDALVIKASVGTFFKVPLFQCHALAPLLREAQQAGAKVAIMAADSAISLFDYSEKQHTLFVLGNETHGVSDELMQLADTRLMIPMANGVESLNVAMTATLIAYSSVCKDKEI